MRDEISIEFPIENTHKEETRVHEVSKKFHKDEMLTCSQDFSTRHRLYQVICISSRIFWQRFTTNERFFAIERKVSRQRQTEKTRKSLAGRLCCWENYAAGFRMRRKETDCCNLFSVFFLAVPSFFFSLSRVYFQQRGMIHSGLGWIFKETID